ncbi:MAG TPA: hypothetical protein VF158_00845, partial [Longimicrobiales bacterium]
QRAILEGAAYAVHARVLIEDADGNLANIDDAEGGGWFIGARWSEDIDHPVADATIELRRDAGDALSLSPLRTDSPVNRDSAGAYAPRVEMGRQVVIQAAATAPEELPSEAGYVTLFHGVIDRVAAASDPLVLTCRDLGGVLVDRQIETEITYGAPEGVPLETVMQQVLDDHAPGIVLNVPASPGFMVTEYTPSDVSVMEALQTLAGTIGWDVRYRWNEAAGEFQLTLQEPDREKVDPDHTIGPDLYADLRALELDSEDVRNVIDVVYPDAATGEIETVRVEDAASIARYGRRYMRIEEGSDSPIDTAAEALALADAALSDLKDPLASHEIGMLFWPAVELGDVYRYLANGVHYDIDQTFAVVAYRHELRPDRQRTTITARGRPAGAYLRWLVRG